MKTRPVARPHFDGHVNATNVDNSFPASGLIWCQSWGGNWFAARNTISNYWLEAIQWNSGPAAAAQNRYVNGRMNGATAALCNPVYGTAGPTSQPADLGFSFVGNTVVGGRQGVFGVFHDPAIQVDIASLLVSGNHFNLALPFPIEADGPGAAANLLRVDCLNLSANTVTDGSAGLMITKVCTSAVLLQNDFSGVGRLSVDELGASVSGSVIAKNKMSEGVSFHLRALMAEGVHHFLLQNTYVSTNGTAVNPFLEPLALPVHHQP